MLIKVTQSHLNCGTRTAQHCPIALAIKDAGESDVFVSKIKATTARAVFRLPNEAQIFIMAFDSGRAVKPFKFKLEVEAKNH